LSAEAFRVDLAAARAQCKAGAGSVLDVLLRTGRDPRALREAIKVFGGVACFDVTSAKPDFSLWTLAHARASKCVALRGAAGMWMAAAEDPWDEAMLMQLSRVIGASPQVYAVSQEQLHNWLSERVSGERAIGGSASAAPVDGPIAQFVDQGILAAYRNGASDVHFECDGAGVSVKHRLDGVLVPFARMDGVQQAEETVSRIKVLAKLDITERRLPQDGRYRQRASGADVDVRVSIMPSVHGEDAVLRLLDKAQLRGAHLAVTLDSLGFTTDDAKRIRDLAIRPSGMLLVTGPTGSGKTTTVYASLSEIQTGQEKIITIEDPVEYELAGVLQIPVNEKKGLTFARGLRSILRHDPDRILVGEIRDAETAEIAVQSALTGHVVFTTVHANSVSDIVGRFRHFDIDMFGFMSALNGIVVQRLVRRLCAACAEKRELTEEDRLVIGCTEAEETHRIRRPVGCPQCHGTGYKGRFVIAEVHTIDDHFRDLATGGAALSALKQHALARTVMPLQERSLQYVLDGQTTFDEIYRVVGKGP
jgi:general secretion pathway protein E